MAVSDREPEVLRPFLGVVSLDDDEGALRLDILFLPPEYCLFSSPLYPASIEQFVGEGNPDWLFNHASHPQLHHHETHKSLSGNRQECDRMEESRTGVQRSRGGRREP